MSNPEPNASAENATITLRYLAARTPIAPAPANVKIMANHPLSGPTMLLGSGKGHLGLIQKPCDVQEIRFVVDQTLRGHTHVFIQ